MQELNEEQQDDGIAIVTVPARLGETYAAGIPGKNVIVVAADTWEQQLRAIMKLTEGLLDLSAARARHPAARSDRGG